MAEPLRVVHLGKYYPPAPGGIESLVRDMAVAQAADGMNVTVHAFQHHKGQPTSHETENGVQVFRHQRKASVAKLDISPGLLDHIRNCQPDVIHVHVPNPSMILALLASRGVLAKAPVVVGYHADVVRQKLRSLLFRPLERRFYRHVAAITAPSPVHIESSEFLRPYKNRLHSVPLALKLDEYLNPTAADMAEADRLRQSAPGPIWLACGRLVYYKGFVTAIAALSQSRTRDGQLWIIGTGPDRDSLEAEARRLGVADRVRFLGHVKRTVPYYQAANSFWFPSNARSESFGLAQVEAMASGCPVINTAIPNSGVSWVSQHGVSGLTVPVGNSTELARCADLLATDHSLRDHYAAGARQRAMAEFDIRVMVSRLNMLYSNVLGKNHQIPAGDTNQPTGQPEPAHAALMAALG